MGSRSPGWRTSRPPVHPRSGRRALRAVHATAPVFVSGHGGLMDEPPRSAILIPVAILLLALISARVAEIIPGAAALRPSLAAALVGGVAVGYKMTGTTFSRAWKNPVLLAYAAYGGWAILTAPFGIWPGHAVRSIYPIFAPGLVMVFVLALCPPRLDVMDRISRGLVAALGVQFLSVLSASHVFRGRLYGGASLDPNDLASCAAIVFPFAVMLMTRKDRIGRLIGAVVAPLSVFLLVDTASRGGTLAFGASVLTLVMLLPGHRRFIALAALAVSVPVAWTFAPQTFRLRISSLTHLEDDYNTTDYFGRSAIWKRGITYAKERPLTGVGLGNFDTAEGMSQREQGLPGKWSAPHSAYIQALAELGFPGAAIFLTLLLRTGRAFARLARRAGPGERRPEYLAGLVGFSVGAIFLSHAYFWLFFGLVALGALASELGRRDPLLAAASSQGLRPGRRPVRALR